MIEFRVSLRCIVVVQFQSCLIFTILKVLPAIIEKTPKEIERKMKEHDIVPDIVDYPAKHELMMKYVHGYIPNFGNDLNPNDLEEPPFFVRFEREVDEYFTILMIDPDQPSRSGPEESEWVHWLVTNMDGCSVLSGDTIVTYLTPKPEQGTGPHRYIFFVFKQADGPMTFDEKVINDTRYEGNIRGYFKTKEFIKRNHFGAPHAANFFYSEWKPPRRSATTSLFTLMYADDPQEYVDYGVFGIPKINNTSLSNGTGKRKATTKHPGIKN